MEETAMTRPQDPHDLHLLCPCTGFGIPLIRVAAWDESFLRFKGADYRCPSCTRGKRALLVSHPIFGTRLRFKRI